MKLKAAVFFALILSYPAKALTDTAGKWDYAYSLGLRTQPLGAGVWGELGYNQLLWGEAPSAKNPFYGYLRPKISAQSSGIVNRADVGMDFAFWAPIVFEVTQGWDHRSGDFSGFDCTSLQCRGLLKRTKVAVKLTAGYEAYFLLWDSLLEYTKGPHSPQRNFVDQYWNLMGSYESDSLISSELTLGRKISEEYSVGLLGSKSRFEKSHEESTSTMAFLAFKKSQFRYFLGAGIYESSRVDRAFATAFGMKWVGNDSFSIR